jgi:hypothetical protein
MTQAQTNINLFVAHYLSTALWAEAEDGEEFTWRFANLAQETLRYAQADAQWFFNLAEDKGIDLGTQEWAGKMTRIAYDFLLTRNGHGAGFWDGDWDEPLAGKFCEISEEIGQVDFYVGDDGLIYSQ